MALWRIFFCAIFGAPSYQAGRHSVSCRISVLLDGTTSYVVAHSALNSMAAPAAAAAGAGAPSQSSQYSPISTLERQYVAPVGRRLTVIVRANPACLVEGGVEAVLRAGRNQQGNAAGGSLPPSMSTMSTTSVATADSASGGVDLVRFDSSVSLASSAGSDGASGTSTPTGRASSGGGGGLKGLSSKLARAARGAQDHIERGVTGLAIQAEKSRNKVAGGTARVRPDVMAVAAYVRTPLEETCVGMTEDVDIPSGMHNGAGLEFSVPLVISPSIAGQAQDVAISFRLFIKSGATMLAGKGKRFVIGNGVANLSQLQSVLNSATASAPAGSYCAGRCSIPVVGPSLPPGGNAALDLIVGADTKFPALCGIGWTLADPRVDTAYQGPLFNLPLDNPLCYPMPASMGPAGGVLHTTERVTESAAVLPIAVACAKLFSDGAARSTGHAADVAKALRNNALQFDDPMSAVESGHAQCQLEIAYVLLNTPGSQPPSQASSGRATVSANLQRPDSIFEARLGSSSVPVYQYDPNINYSTASALSAPFYPRICAENDPRLLPGLATARVQQMQATGTTQQANIFVGTVRIEVEEKTLPADVTYGSASMGMVADDPRALGPGRTLEAHIPIEPLINAPNGGAFVQVPIHDQKTAAVAGTIVLSLDVQLGRSGGAGSKPVPVLARGGLVSLVGLDTLVEDLSSHPRLDFDEDFPAAVLATQGGNAASQEEQAALARRRRIATMGDFFLHHHLQNHITTIRSVDTNKLIERHQSYRSALNGTVTSTAAAFEEPSNKRRDPRPFRPSSSRLEEPLCGIPFNVHIQTYSLIGLEPKQAGSPAAVSSKPMALYHNITHGAPSDHARGFSGPVSPAAAVPGARGGLRRLEAARLAAAQRVRENQNELINAVAAYFGQAAQTMALPGHVTARRHVPSGHSQITRIHNRVVESVQSLHALTWDVAVRRASVFSQALGIGLTSYLAHVSDAAKVAPSANGGGWPEIWKRSGFLVTFEGLLSAAGKELGMIEDASVGIALLRMVSMVFVPDGAASSPTQQSRVNVPHSPYLRWINLIPSGVGSATQYRLEIGIDQGYFNQRVPAALRDGCAVRFYPVLFQMGVDIRQWGVNAAVGAKNQVTGGQQQAGNRRASGFEDDDPISGPAFGDEDGGGLLDDEDDDVGDPDNDVLIALNLEGFRKMNAYSHSVMPSTTGPTIPQSWEQASVQAAPGPASQQQPQIPVHSAVARLNDYIRSSAGNKMEHGVLDEAATVAAKLGGGAAIFCKSGKDRTAMQVTHKQSQFLNRYLSGTLAGGAAPSEDAVSPRKIFADASMMRIYGTRLPICEKNVGQALYAFNSLQSKFMPDALKPPPAALAGFLKKGKVFSKEARIES